MQKDISNSPCTARSCTAAGTWCACGRADRRDAGHDNWLLIKGKDEEARSGRAADILEAEPLSAATGRSMEEIAGGKGRKRVWHSNRKRRRARRSSQRYSASPAAIAARIQGAIEGARRRADEAGEQIGGTRAKPAKKPAAKPRTRGKIGRGQGGAQKRAGVPRRRRAQQTGAFTRRLAGLRPAEPRHAARRRAERKELAARDQVRRLPHRGAARSRQGAAV